MAHALRNDFLFFALFCAILKTVRKHQKHKRTSGKDTIMKRRKGIVDTETSMRGMWVIIKGQYLPGLGVDSFDPEGESTREWYQIMDRYTYNTIACGSEIERIKKGLIKTVKEFKTQEAYYKYLSDTTTEDYYLTHFCGLPPYSPKDRDDMKDAGIMCTVSNNSKEVYAEVVAAYGDYYDEYVEDVVDSVYAKIDKKTSPKSKLKIIKSRQKTQNVVEEDLILIDDSPVSHTGRTHTSHRASAHFTPGARTQDSHRAHTGNKETAHKPVDGSPRSKRARIHIH